VKSVRWKWFSWMVLH